jgi:DNA helicase-2/ATP-dependent DNA helicase PcrA
VKQIELGFEVEADFRRSTGTLDRDDPWFGRVQLETAAGDTLTYRVGERTVPDEAIVDWRDPASEPLYTQREGDWVDVDVAGRRLQGRLKNRARVRSRGRKLQQVELFTEDGARTLDLEPGPAHQPDQLGGLPDIRSLLTKEQYELIRATRDRPVILQGRAGSGKTTVALYRVSWLTYPRQHDLHPPVSADRVLIVMFNRALSAFVSQLLEPLRLDRAWTDTFHAWALEEIRRAYKGEVEVWAKPREDREVAAAVKRNIGMLDAVEAFVERQTARLHDWMQDRLRPYAAIEWEAKVREEPGPPVRRLKQVQREVCILRDAAEGHERQRLEQIIRIFDRAVFRMSRYKEELLALLTDRALLREHLHGVQPWDLDMMVRFQQGLQHEHAPKGGLGPYVAFEDFALLVRLIQLKHGGFPAADGSPEVRLFDHLLVDEAQDFGPVELTVLFKSVRSPRDITIVGDINQKIVPDIDFIGWSRIAKRLGVDDAAVAHLEVGHRSTSPIMDLADFVLHRERSAEGRSGVKPTLDLLENADARTHRIIERLEQRWAERPSAHLCVVCRQREDARDMYETLAGPLGTRHIPVRLGHNKSFDFSPGVTVTNARQLKGLEFDTVVVADPGPDAYPDDPEGRRLLYTVVTRAREVLHLVSGIHPSPIIEAASEAGMLDVVDETEVEPVRFSEDEDAPF